MKYIFNCLIIDDDPDFENRIDDIIEILNDEYKCDVKIDFAKKITDITPEKYDLILIDFDLKRVFKHNGDYFISQIRNSNRIVKIIFYSSKFKLDDKNEFHFIDVSETVIFNIINKWNVDRIIPRDNFDLLVESINECCTEFDLTVLGLYKSIEKYLSSGISLSFNLDNGEILKNNELLQELKSDSSNGKQIREKLHNFSINNVLDFSY